MRCHLNPEYSITFSFSFSHKTKHFRHSFLKETCCFNCSKIVKIKGYKKKLIGLFSLNWPHWANSVIELPCLSVCLCVCVILSAPVKRFSVSRMRDFPFNLAGKIGIFLICLVKPPKIHSAGWQ